MTPVTGEAVRFAAVQLNLDGFGSHRSCSQLSLAYSGASVPKAAMSWIS